MMTYRCSVMSHSLNTTIDELTDPHPNSVHCVTKFAPCVKSLSAQFAFDLAKTPKVWEC
jgi:hypothetical protein